MTERQTVAGAYQRIESHEDLCAERYANIHSAIGDLKTIAKWAAGGVVGLMVSLIAWMAVQLYAANNARIEALESPSGVHGR